ncbi:MAG TPA: EamA family transporter [Oceanospirillaceae bacterium]|nr:EamA family transporter [Oceanospirillaceae bacterium]
MEHIAFALVLLAALMHAGWNAMVKINTAPLIAISMMFGFIMLAAILALPWLPPLAINHWPWLGLSLVAHLGYKIYLLRAFRLGDFSQAYPIARGSAPVWVLLASLLLGTESLVALSLAQTIGVAIVPAGIISLAPWRQVHLHRPVLVAALATGLWIASYTLIDGYMVASGATFAAYVGWLFILDGLVINVYAWYKHGGELALAYRLHWPLAALGGAFSVAAYTISLWAMTVLPVAMVAALRETSVLAAVLLAVVWLREPLGLRQYVAATAIGTGLLLLKLV